MEKMDIEQDEEKNKINKIKNYIFIEPIKNKDNSLNLNYCKNRIERNENYIQIKDSDNIKDITNNENKEENNISQNEIININKNISNEFQTTNNNYININNDIASEINSINTQTNLNEINNKDKDKDLSIHLSVPAKKKGKAVNSNNNNNLLNSNLSKLDYFVNLINEKNKIHFNQTNHLCFKLENYIISHQELITEKTKLSSEESPFPLNEENIYNNNTSNPKKKSSNKKYNNKNLDLNLDNTDAFEANDEQEIAQKYKTYTNQPSLKVCIGPSIIHRNGLFALDNIKPGEIVIEYVGEMITNKIADYREIEYNERGFGDCYMFRFDADNIIDATKYGNLARFINHCCEPNCKAQCNEINGKKHILLLAKKFIKAGEEITYDYNFEVESEKIQCRCGAKNCRGRLN